MSAFALTQNLGDFIKLLLDAFNFVSVFPSFIFVILTQMFILPMFPETSWLRIDLISDRGIYTGFCVVLTVLISYFLRAANFGIIRFLEGYAMRSQYPFCDMEDQKRKYVNISYDKLQEAKTVIDELEKAIENAECDDDLEKWGNIVEDLAKQRRKLSKQLVRKYPDNPDLILPLPLGNIIASAEYYPYKLFNIDAVFMWGFLANILNENGYAKSIMQEKSMLDFLINMVTVLCGFGVIYGFLWWWIEGVSLSLVFSLLFIFFICYLIYQLSLRAATNWGLTIRIAFVLYRDDLRKKLLLRSPVNYEDERRIWRNACVFFKAEFSEDDLAKFAEVIF